MLEGITWKSYWVAVIILVVIYYIIIGVIFYRRTPLDFSSKLKRKPAPEDDHQAKVPTIDELEIVVADIKERILERAGEETSKEKLLEQLSTRLENYDGLHVPAFRVALNNFIIMHAEKICGVAFSEDELNEEWKRCPAKLKQDMSWPL